jgi:hypothetical protein
MTVIMKFGTLTSVEASIRAYQAQVARNWRLITQRNRAADLAAAKTLLEKALAHGTLDEVAGIICPPAKRKRGRQWGSHSKRLAARRAALWQAYQEEKTKSPEATDKEIAGRLHAKDSRAYGNSPSGIAARIAKIKVDQNAPSLLAKAGYPRRRGRPKKSINPI